MAEMSYRWRPAGGIGSWNLSQLAQGYPTGFGVLEPVTGLQMPPVEILTDNIPLRAGARLRQVRIQPRDIQLPVLLVSSDAASVDSVLSQFRVALDPSRGPGSLEIGRLTGDYRKISAYYTGNWIGEVSNEQSGKNWTTFMLVLRALDPYWEDLDPTYLTFSLGTGSHSFLSTAPDDPFFPLTISSSTVLVDTPVTNNGEVEAWPIWTITGPMLACTARNGRTGESWTLTHELLTQQRVTIDTRPGIRTVKQDTTSLFTSLSADSWLWSLPTGASQVHVEMGGSTADSTVQMAWSQRYLGA